MFGKLFCFACISAWENDKILIFFSKDAPSKAIQKLYEQIPIWKQKSLPKIFWLRTIWWELVLSCRFFVLSMAEIINNSQWEFVITIFVELFTAHHLKNNSRFYHLPKPRYRRNKKMLQTCWHTRKTIRKIEKIVHDSVVTGSHP